MGQCWNCLTQFWNWNQRLVKDTFWDEIELLFEWKLMKNFWKKSGKTYTIITIIIIIQI